MAGQTGLYEEDILAWTEEQAAALRALAGRRDLPNALDLPNVIEEIETLGRTELGAATSPIRLILEHLVKLAVLPESSHRTHRVEEVSNWYRDVQDTLAPSMHQRVELPKLWRKARNDVARTFAANGVPDSPPLPETCPLDLAGFSGEEFDLDGAVARVRAALDA